MKGSMKEMVGGCCVCSDERGWPENPLVYCDGQGCTVAVHQACYGIVTVPTGPWYCRKCESQERAARVKCELCPSRDGALKRTDNSGWAHVVCALYIPEVRFGNVTTMEPIILQLIPTERFNKVCYICDEQEKGSRSTVGACMQCNKSGCRMQFHVTCAQALGLLCEEAGNYLDNVKYCGYCQHHYSKLKKGGNVKTIPPYKPIPTDNHSSDSSPEKEGEAAANANSKTAPPSSSSSSSGKRKSNSSNSKSSSSSSKSSTSTSKSNISSTSSHQKTVHTSSSNKQTSAAEKSSKNYSASSNNSKSTAKNTDSETNPTNTHPTETDVKTIEKPTQNTKDINSAKFPNANFSETVQSDVAFPEIKSDSNLSSSSVKESSKNSKKRKANSRTPTPNSVTQTETEKSVAPIVISVTTQSIVTSTQSSTSTVTSTATSDRRDSVGSTDSVEKSKKPKIEATPHPIVANLTATTQRTTSSPTVISEPPPVPSEPPTISPVTTSTVVPPQQNSLVVSVPLVNTSLSPKQGNQTNSNTPNSSTLYQHLPEPVARSPVPPVTTTPSTIQGISSVPTPSTENTMVSSDGGLKITYEKQSGNSSNLSRLNSETPPAAEEQPAKRSRSQSADKPERVGRSKKRGSNGLPILTGPASGAGKRTSRSQHATPPPAQLGAFSSVSQPPITQVKESPPSSPSDENSSAGTSSGRRAKGRKSAPATITTNSSSTPTPMPSNIVEKKEVKVFQNGVHAPHMLGNQLNPNSNMAQKMSDHLHSELEAHSIFNQAESMTNLTGPQLHSKVIASVRSSNSTTSTGSSSSGFTSMLGGGSGGTVPQTLDQLLERQWEQGSQFLMEQAQHFDIASLLSCLHQLRAENLRLEEHVNSLLQRRDHLLAVNARLAIPLTNQQPVAAPTQQHTMNNLHPSVGASHGEAPRSRHSSYSGHSNTPIENGLPPDGAAYPHQHRSPGSSQPPQPSPTIRHSPAGTSYPSTSGHNVVRSSSSEGHRSSSSQRQQPYPYQGQIPVVTQQNQPQQPQQMMMRRDSDLHHQAPSSKPS